MNKDAQYKRTPVEEILNELRHRYVEMYPDQRVGVDYVAAEEILSLRNRVEAYECLYPDLEDFRRAICGNGPRAQDKAHRLVLDLIRLAVQARDSYHAAHDLLSCEVEANRNLEARVRELEDRLRACRCCD
jgi:hypothetical protein